MTKNSSSSCTGSLVDNASATCWKHISNVPHPVHVLAIAHDRRRFAIFSCVPGMSIARATIAYTWGEIGLDLVNSINLVLGYVVFVKTDMYVYIKKYYIIYIYQTTMKHQTYIQRNDKPTKVYCHNMYITKRQTVIRSRIKNTDPAWA